MNPDPAPTTPGPGQPHQAPTPAPRGPTCREWSAYFAAVDGTPRETTLRALEAFDAHALPDSGRRALDLGCGEGRDTRAMLARGWQVTAVDPHPQAAEFLYAKLPSPFASALIYHCRSLESLADTGDVILPARSFALVNASFVLPFVEPARFEEVWRWMLGRLAPGGRFSGQLFGDRDTWATIPGRTHHDRHAALRLLDPLTIELFREDEKDGHDVMGEPKHWHVFHVVARAR